MSLSRLSSVTALVWARGLGLGSASGDALLNRNVLCGEGDPVSVPSSAGVGVAAYADVEAAVNSTAAAGTKILLDPKVLNYGLRQLAGESAILETSPIATPKAMKNEAELNGMIEAHLTDGASLALAAPVECACTNRSEYVSQVARSENGR